MRRLELVVALSLPLLIAKEAQAQSSPAGATTQRAASAGQEASSGRPGNEPEVDLTPVDNTWQMGMGLGIFLPSSELDLIGAGYQPAQFSTAAFQFFGRIGYYPKSFLGIEGEVVTMLAGVSNEGAAMYALRTHVVLQYPTGSIIPFATVGVGALGAASGLTGHAVGAALYFGLGLKFPLTRDLAMRFDLRENLSKARSASASVAGSEDVTFGLELTLGRPKPAAPEEPSDIDGDRVVDDLDLCPSEPALTADGCPADSDGDGLPDMRDVCPTEAGLLTLRGCPEADPDEDGVKFPCDRCPEVPGKGPDGCPLGDSDDDGLLDDVDQCRDQPETPNGFRDSDGCPDEIPKSVQDLLGDNPELGFRAGGDRVQGQAVRRLEQVQRVLSEYPELTLEVRVYVSSMKGNSDEQRSLANRQLSERRAAAIVSWLVERGVERKRLQPVGAGDQPPDAEAGGTDRVELLLSSH